MTERVPPDPNHSPPLRPTRGRALPALLSIGIFAHNEEKNIGRTLRALFAQTLLREPPAGLSVEVVVVPNGCRDRTGERARDVLRELTSTFHERVSATVQELPAPGKSRSWNVYVHELSDPRADLLLCLDGDITFKDDACLSLLLEKLLSTPEAVCAVGRPLKDVAVKPAPSLRERLSLLASSTTREGPATIAGSMYLAWADVLRRIWMPAGLLTEDGFLRAMLITELFTNPAQRTDRIVREERASQIFEAVTSVRGVFKHSRRLLMGARINAFLYDKLWALPAGSDAGAFAQGQPASDPQWLRGVIREALAGKGRWVMQRGLLSTRLRGLRHKPPQRALLHLPVVLALLPFDLAVLVSANRAVREGDLRW